MWRCLPQANTQVELTMAVTDAEVFLMVKELIEGPVQRLSNAAWQHREDDCVTAGAEIGAIMIALLKEVRDEPGNSSTD